MKRTALILLTAIYTVSCLGMGANRLYCCGKLMSVTFTYGADYNTARQTDQKHKCCKNEKHCFKVKDSHFNVASVAFNRPAPTLSASFISLYKVSIAGLAHAEIVYKGNAPPGYPVIPAYTLNCAYRI